MINNKVLILLAIGVLLASGIVARAKAGTGDPGSGSGGCGSCSPKESTCRHADTQNKDQNTRQAEVFACPMHPEITSTDPEARCPSCDMKLVPSKLYACPMDPDQMSTDPEAKCLKCDMKMEPVQGQLYVCPMHPDEISTDPEAKCSICDMKMEPFNMPDMMNDKPESNDSQESS